MMKKCVGLLFSIFLFGCAKTDSKTDSKSVVLEAPIKSAEIYQQSDGKYTLSISVWETSTETWFCESWKETRFPYNTVFYFDEVLVTVDSSKDEAFLQLRSENCHHPDNYYKLEFSRAEILVPNQRYADVWNRELSRKRVKKVVLPELKKE